MGKMVTARYDAQSKVLQLVEPLEGVEDQAEVMVNVEAPTEPGKEPWREFAGSLRGEAGEDFARVIEELFPIER